MLTMKKSLSKFIKFVKVYKPEPKFIKVYKREQNFLKVYKREPKFVKSLKTWTAWAKLEKCVIP